MRIETWKPVAIAGEEPGDRQIGIEVTFRCACGEELVVACLHPVGNLSWDEVGAVFDRYLKPSFRRELLADRTCEHCGTTSVCQPNAREDFAAEITSYKMLDRLCDLLGRDTVASS